MKRRKRARNNEWRGRKGCSKEGQGAKERKIRISEKVEQRRRGGEASEIQV